jgi:hydroxybutyrate-dimer hydrolase
VHSQVNPEKDWGQDTLIAVRYALYALNEEYGKQLPTGEHEARFTPDNTLVIAGSVFGGTSVPTFGKPLIDYITYANLYQPCAALAATAVMTELSPYNLMVVTPSMTLRAANRCAALSARGLVSGGSIETSEAQGPRSLNPTAEERSS